MKYFIAPLLFLSTLLSCTSSNPDQEEWIDLFNGKNLDGWTIKVANHPLGENYNNTVRVEEGLLKMVYDDYTSFDGDFTHFFY